MNVRSLREWFVVIARIFGDLYTVANVSKSVFFSFLFFSFPRIQRLVQHVLDMVGELVNLVLR